MLNASIPAGGRVLTAALIGARAAERLAGFAGFLRANGFTVGGGDAVQSLRTAQHAGVLDANVLRWNLQALLCGRADEWRRFDDLFDAWFLPANRWQAPAAREIESASNGLQADGAPAGATRDVDDDAARPRHTASRDAALGSADFRTLTEREHTLDIEALMRRFARQLKHIQLRREVRARQGRRLDLPTTIRRSVASGGTPFRLAWRQHRRVQPRLVLLIDVSRSMSIHSFFYLRLARALAAERTDVHSFIFHTRVTAVSQALHDPDPWRAQEQLHLIAQGFGGGTRIGDSLAQFNREHAARIVHSRTAVVVLSDGYDTGEPQRLADALIELKRRARRIVWINPLCNQPGYAPIAQGMQAALPHLDLLAPGGDLNSLRAVLPNLLHALH
jgi:uncharacterized protein with von Willebrand factor type A (vWA) domain